MYYGHLLGNIVRRLREMRNNGASSRELMSYLQPKLPNVRPLAAVYMNHAFLGQGLKLVNVLRFGPWDRFGPDDEIWAMADSIIDDAKSTWTQAPVAELMRVRDYFSFLKFTQDYGLVVTVLSASPSSARWIGSAGARCYDGRMVVPVCDSGAYAGLLAADPADPRVKSVLAAYGNLSYARYAETLHADGYRVLSAENDFLVVDGNDRSVYPGYRLQGVYHAKTYERAWTGSRGDELRSALNRYLGDELVRVGPHDDWEHRNNPAVAGPLVGPQVPVVEFDRGERINSYVALDKLVHAPQYEPRWREIYPES
jgi:hypothetical protein